MTGTQAVRSNFAVARGRRELWPATDKPPYSPRAKATIQYNTAANDADAGRVRIQAVTIRVPTLQRTAEKRWVMPTPKMAPVMVCVVLTGMPNHERTRMVAPPPVSAQNPPTG